MTAMPLTLSRERFAAACAAGDRVIPVSREIFADGETPIGIYRKLATSAEDTFLLESADQGGIWSRYSFIGVRSFGALSQSGHAAVWLSERESAERILGADAPSAPLDALRSILDRWRTPAPEGLPPLVGGLVGFIGWDAVRQIESLPEAPPAEIPVPTQSLLFVSDLVAMDHRSGSVVLIANVLNDGRDDVETLWADACARLDTLQSGLAAPGAAHLADVDFTLSGEPQPRTRRDDFLASVETAKEHIRAGDIFQVVISQRFEQPSPADPLDVYRVLRSLNPSPYMYLLQMKRPDGEPFAVVGSSPEALVKVGRGHAITHPIAGSRPRGATPEADVDLAAELSADEKERAEHLMLVDLARNDLLKVCRAGSVEVTEFMRIERFSHIMHLVSSVEGELRDDADPVDVFTATFPAGTLSGAPKPRALEIIDALEPAGRGVYGGVVGYFAHSGDLDLAIAIRTATIVEGTAYVQAGGGLVADSVPESEYQESVNKAAAPVRAVAIAAAMTEVH